MKQYREFFLVLAYCIGAIVGPIALFWLLAENKILTPDQAGWGMGISTLFLAYALFVYNVWRDYNILTKPGSEKDPDAPDRNKMQQ